jgi:hypothetical protein
MEHIQITELVEVITRTLADDPIQVQVNEIIGQRISVSGSFYLFCGSEPGRLKQDNQRPLACRLFQFKPYHPVCFPSY